MPYECSNVCHIAQACPMKLFQYLLGGYPGRNVLLKKPEYIISMLYLHLQDRSSVVEGALNTLIYPG